MNTYRLMDESSEDEGVAHVRVSNPNEWKRFFSSEDSIANTKGDTDQGFEIVIAAEEIV